MSTATRPEVRRTGAETKRPRPSARRGLIVIAFALVFGGLVLALPLHGIDPWAQRVLAIVTTALVLWIGEGLDLAVTSLAVIAMLAVFGPKESSASTHEALFGFQQTAGYFILSTLVVATATVRSGLAARLARVLIAGAKGSARRMYFQLVVFMPFFAMIVPSATTRNAILLPAYDHVYERYGVERGDRVSKSISLALALLQMVASTAVLTGGVLPITAAFLLGGMSWGEWFRYMAVPCYLVIFISAIILFAWQRPHMATPRLVETGQPEVPESKRVPWDPAEVRSAIVIGIMTLLWLNDFLTGWDPLIPALLGGVALLAPGIGVISWKDFEGSSPWTLFLVTGSALSIAHAMEESGAATWLANNLLGHVPLDSMPDPLLLLTLLVVVVPVSVMLPNRAGALGILVPLLTSICVKIGINPIPIGLMATLVVQTTTFYSMQNASTLLVYQSRHFAPFDLLRAGLIVFGVSLLVIVTIAVPWWSLVGLPLHT
ncbi:MAG TPA: SLC13 family permease [Nitrolancea sp.]|nr:SLC13 family permease [Nitrolancea sp.]